MIEIWLLFCIGTILCYGTGQQFSKKGVQLIGSYQTGILYTIASVCIQTTYWVLLPDDKANDLNGILMAIFAGIMGAWGFVFYIFALKSGKVSLVSVITAGYPAVSVVLAITLIGDVLTIPQTIGILLVIMAIIFISLPTKADRVESRSNENGPKKSRRWLMWAVLSLIFWGIWAIPSQVAMRQIGESDYIFIDGLTMVLTWVPLWLFFERGRMNRDVGKLSFSGTAGILASFGTVSLFLAISNGQVSVVTPITSIYPLFTVLLARFALKEKLDPLQYGAIAAGVLGIILLAV